MLFEVKGWNVSAPLVTQTEDSQSRIGFNGDGIDLGNKVGKSGSKSSRRKRKRGVSDGEGGDHDGLAADTHAAAPLAGAVARATSASASASDAALMSADRIGKLWERHVEKKVKDKKQKRKKKEKKTDVNGKIVGERRRMESGELEKDKDQDKNKKRVEDGRGNRTPKDANANGNGDATHNNDEDARDVKRKKESRGTKISKADRLKERKLLNANGKSTSLADEERVQMKIDEATPGEIAATVTTTAQSEAVPSTKLTPLQNQMREKLISARFRRLNETLYTSPSAEAIKLFQSQPDLFHEYHAGFARQVAAWPANPVDGFISAVLARGKIESADQKRRMQYKQHGKNKKRKKMRDDEGLNTEEQGQEQAGLQPLPRTRGTCNIVDIGCGTAPLARALQSHMSRLRLSIRNFDLLADGSDSAGATGGSGAAPVPPVRIEQADMCSLPVASATVDIAILCLALMGTNWPEAIDEAWRILRWKGEVWIAETKSRFGHTISTSGGGRTGAGGIGRKKANAKPQKHRNGSKNKHSSVKSSNTYANDEHDANDDEQDNEEEEDNDEETLGISTLSTSISPPVSNTTTTHLLPFLTVLQRRGFVLAQDGPGNNDNNNSDNHNDKKGGDSDKETDVPPNLDSNTIIKSTSAATSASVSASAVDTSNKMFVTMRLVKATMPVRGRNNKKEDKKENQQQHQQQRQRDSGRENGRGRGKWKTTVVDDDDDDEDGLDAKVLKACVYKLR